MTGNTHQITPFMHVADFSSAVSFLTDTIGFQVLFEKDEYAYLEREGAGLRVLGSSEAGEGHGGFAYYIDVKSVEAVQEQIGAKLAKLPAGTVVGPRDQTYGQRELMIRAPDGNVLVFGAAIAK